jgi:hypothetical protein
MAADLADERQHAMAIADMLTGGLIDVLIHNVPGAWNHLEEAFRTARNLEDRDLKYWYDVPNTCTNRDHMPRHATAIIDACVESLSRLFCEQLGVTE